MNCETKREIVEKFVDRTPNESTYHNRLMTFENESGNVIIVGHGWNTLAEYDEERGVVTVFTGHTSIESRTTNGYLNLITEVARERGRDVVLSGDSPLYAQPTDATQYINNYISFRDKSPVEQDAQAEVREQLKV